MYFQKKMKRICAMICCLSLVMQTTACAQQDKKVTKSALKMDTTMNLTAYGAKASEAIDAAYERIDEIEQMASSTIPDSDISQINDAAGESYVKVHPEIIKMLETAVEYSSISEGAFDITVNPLIKLWGIGTDDQRVPSDDEIQSALTLVGYKNISINDQDNTVKLLNKGMSIDLGGIAKGFAADEVEKIFKDYGIASAVINLGDSTIYTMGNKPGGSLWTIAISNPRSTDNAPYLGVINIPQMALSTSGDYERYFIQDGKRYHHILSPFTGYPADAGVMSDTILIDSNVENCNMLADVCTKIVFIYGVDKGFQIIDHLQGVSCMAVTTDYQVRKSANWNVPLNNLDSEYHE